MSSEQPSFIFTSTSSDPQQLQEQRWQAATLQTTTTATTTTTMMVTPSSNTTPQPTRSSTAVAVVATSRRNTHPHNQHHNHNNHHHVRQHHHERRHRRRGRLWQLPKSSIQEYAKWITEKPAEDQSLAEQTFVCNYQRRCHLLQHKLPKERFKDYVGRLETSNKPLEEHTPMEQQLIQKFHRRRAERGSTGSTSSGSMGVVPPAIFWTRNQSNHNPATTTHTPPSSPSPTFALMSGLKESMDRLGLSSNKLREVSMEDDSK
jgi:hypothetical protein